VFAREGVCYGELDWAAMAIGAATRSRSAPWSQISTAMTFSSSSSTGGAVEQNLRPARAHGSVLPFHADER